MEMQLISNQQLISKSGLELTHQKMMQTLDWAYEQTLTGLPGERSIFELANDYLVKYEPEQAINHMVRFQTSKAATSGFVTGFGGLLTLPITLPINITTVILFQIRMIATIAHIRGYDLKCDQVRTLVYATLAGTTAGDILKKTGIKVSNEVVKNCIKKLPAKTIRHINKQVGFRLVTKFGTKGTIVLGKAIPVAGALFGSAFDAGTTYTLAKLAKKTFEPIK
ncbi:MAG: EcsC family protein [Culicoidibacterales bacterium]